MARELGNAGVEAYQAGDYALAVAFSQHHGRSERSQTVYTTSVANQHTHAVMLTGGNLMTLRAGNPVMVMSSKDVLQPQLHGRLRELVRR
jgi:hypothetical protein